MTIHELLAGVHHFQGHAFRQQKELFEQLEKGQNPETLFITCSDSRINPNLITNTAPGDLFVLRNAGNIVPAYTPTATGETATIEFAINALGVKHIIVCGHNACGAMKGLLNPELLETMPVVADWLRNAEATRRIVRSKYAHLTGDALLDVATEENVLTQLENLQTHPSVAVALANGQLSLHAWVYEIASGEVYAYDLVDAQFRRLGDVLPQVKNPSVRAHDVRSGDARFA